MLLRKGAAGRQEGEGQASWLPRAGRARVRREAGPACKGLPRSTSLLGEGIPRSRAPCGPQVEGARLLLPPGTGQEWTLCFLEGSQPDQPMQDPAVTTAVTPTQVHTGTGMAAAVPGNP